MTSIKKLCPIFRKHDHNTIETLEIEFEKLAVDAYMIGSGTVSALIPVYLSVEHVQIAGKREEVKAATAAANDIAIPEAVWFENIFSVAPQVYALSYSNGPPGDLNCDEGKQFLVDLPQTIAQQSNLQETFVQHGIDAVAALTTLTHLLSIHNDVNRTLSSEFHDYDKICLTDC
ncbi:hypothetical protein BDB00DRAFT_868119 [Zychaea mexicana]|uniref:uncharacterized protein n=1 Tax=Zychaea mexicana TaxID=64656 RepID=UPI0022FEA9C3|nr:uncharacterized protein BDB00DRAFT_868119 [Zychaea mexicana]KAI9497985.1 hypothetical protein BDB00DRAFT_868119 [Zychaea mexicana]